MRATLLISLLILNIKFIKPKEQRWAAVGDLIEWGAEYLNSTRGDVTEKHKELANFADKAKKLGLNLGTDELQDFVDDAYTASLAYKSKPEKKPWWKFWGDEK